MKKENKVFIASSIDGYIADNNGNTDWLHSIPNPDQIDMGYTEFISQIDALLMGRATFEVVRGFDIEWPYDKPVFVLSTTLKFVPEDLKDKVEIIDGSLTDILESLHNRGYKSLYIDGGKTIQSFLEEDLIDEMTITTIPTILGEGIPLFGKQVNKLDFECVESKIFLGKVVQNRFVRKK